MPNKCVPTPPVRTPPINRYAPPTLPTGLCTSRPDVEDASRPYPNRYEIPCPSGSRATYNTFRCYENNQLVDHNNQQVCTL